MTHSAAKALISQSGESFVVINETQKVHHESPPQPPVEISSDKLPIVYSEEYGVKFCGLQKLHPFDAAKGHHIVKILKGENLLAEGNFYVPSEITKEELLEVHKKEYLKSLKWSINAAKISEIVPLLLVPNHFVQRGYLRPMRFQTAGSILAGKLALTSGWAINLGGGFHHCCSYRGGGFCAYADITLLVTKILREEKHIARVMIVDLDAHQGNGHERDFCNNNNVFILDMYNASIYPKDHVAKESIKCAVELRPFTEDAAYLKKLERSLKDSIGQFQPNLIVYNAGTDILKGDSLGLLSISPQGVINRDEYVFTTCIQSKIPIVMLLSGGYLKSSAVVIANSILNLRAKEISENRQSAKNAMNDWIKDYGKCKCQNGQKRASFKKAEILLRDIVGFI